MKEAIEIAEAVLRSQFTVALLLIFFMFLMNRRQIRHERNTELKFLECEAYGVLDRSHRDSFKNIAIEMRQLYIGAVSGKREPSPELRRIDEHFHEVRRAVHDSTKRRAQKLHESVEELRKHIEDNLL